MEQVTLSRCHIRWMIRYDMPKVVATDGAWTEEDFYAALRQRNVIGMVIEDARGVIIGFMLYELHKRHLGVIRLAVEPTRRRLGVGSLLVEKLVGKLATHKRRRITSEVPETNLDALLFLKATGFEATNVIRREGEDLIVLTRGAK